MRILVVEDNSDAREMLQTVLRLEGHDIAAATNGEEAWRMFQASPWLLPTGSCRTSTDWSFAVGFTLPTHRTIPLFCF
jgi:CheY-like chemotaxis protein